MKRIAWGMVAGGAAAAAFLGAGAANADAPAGTDTPSWSPVYDIDHASLVQAPGSTALTWELPASFTHNGTPTADLTGTDYVTPSAGGFNNEFVTSTGAVYDQNQLFQGFTNLYYDSGLKDASPVDMLKTPFGTFDISQFASVFAPADPSKFLTSTDGLENAGLYSTLDLGLKDATDSTKWAPVYGDTTAMQASDTSAPVWATPATFTTGTGTDATTLTGTDYLAPSLGGYDNEFVTSTGAVYDQDQLFQGFTNLYYSSGVTGDAPVDMLKTPFGTFDISSLASFFAPEDYSKAIDASPLTDLQDSGLYSALDLGLQPASGGAADVAGLF